MPLALGTRLGRYEVAGRGRDGRSPPCARYALGSHGQHRKPARTTPASTYSVRTEPGNGSCFCPRARRIIRPIGRETAGMLCSIEVSWVRSESGFCRCLVTKNRSRCFPMLLTTTAMGEFRPTGNGSLICPPKRVLGKSM